MKVSAFLFRNLQFSLLGNRLLALLLNSLFWLVEGRLSLWGCRIDILISAPRNTHHQLAPLWLLPKDANMELYYRFSSRYKCFVAFANGCNRFSVNFKFNIIMLVLNIWLRIN